jgi:hypothetical protein
MACVEKTKAVANAMENKQWEKAVELRGRWSPTVLSDGWLFFVE